MTVSQGTCCAKQTISESQSLCYTPSKLFNCKKTKREKKYM
jgi:hypothetical protein